MTKPCYDKWWEWSHCIECAMCSGEYDCNYHDQFTPDEAEAEKERAAEEVKNRLEPAHDFSDPMDAIRYGMTPFRAINDYYQPIQVRKPEKRYKDILKITY